MDIDKLVVPDHLDSREKVDAAISDVLSQLKRLYTIRNSFAPINARLPPEILCNIFLYVQPRKRVSYEWTDGPSYRQLTRAINVCRRWRNIAIQCSELWTHINLGGEKEWRDLLITRSKAAPLTIAGHFTPGSCIVSDYHNTITLQWNRIHRLEIVLVDNVAWRSLVEYSSHHPIVANSLEVVNIRKDLGGSYRPDADSSLPPQDITISLPRLRRLKTRCFPAHGFICSTLIELHLVTPFPLETVASLVFMLRDLPSLQKLTIMRVFSHKHDYSAVSVEPAHFPSLRELVLVDEAVGPCAAFLQNIVFPASARIRIRVGTNKRSESDVEYDMIHRAIVTRRQDSTYAVAPPLLSCSLGCNDMNKLPINLYSTHETGKALARGGKAVSSEPDLSVVWLGPLLCKRTRSFLRSFSPILSQLRIMCCNPSSEPEDDDHIPDEAEFYCALLGRLGALEELRVQWTNNSLMDDLTSSLGIVQYWDDPGGMEKCFARLRTLTISGIDWGTRDDGTFRTNCAECYGRDLLLALYRALDKRKRKESALRRLVLDEWRNVDVGAMKNFAKGFKDAGLLEVFEWTSV